MTAATDTWHDNYYLKAKQELLIIHLFSPNTWDAKIHQLVSLYPNTSIQQFSIVIAI